MLHLRCLMLLLILPAWVLAQGTQADYDRASQLATRMAGKTFKFKVEPNWFADGDRFWYRNDLAEKEKQFIVVDATSGKREVAFDHDALAKALGASVKDEVKGNRLPFTSIDIWLLGRVASMVIVSAIRIAPVRPVLPIVLLTAGPALNASHQLCAPLAYICL